MTLLEFYEEYAPSGKLPHFGGLCLNLEKKCRLDYFWLDYNFLDDSDSCGGGYWGGPVGEFTDLRMNVVLLAALMLGEEL